MQEECSRRGGRLGPLTLPLGSWEGAEAPQGPVSFLSVPLPRRPSTWPGGRAYQGHISPLKGELLMLPLTELREPSVIWGEWPGSSALSPRGWLSSHPPPPRPASAEVTHCKWLYSPVG